MKKTLERIFRSLGHEGNFFSLLKCSCGSTHWKRETRAFTTLFTCKKCGESHVLLRKSANILKPQV